MEYAVRAIMAGTYIRFEPIPKAAWSLYGTAYLSFQSTIECVGGNTTEELQSTNGREGVAIDAGEDTSIRGYGICMELLGS